MQSDKKMGHSLSKNQNERKKKDAVLKKKKICIVLLRVNSAVSQKKLLKDLISMQSWDHKQKKTIALELISQPFPSDAQGTLPPLQDGFRMYVNNKGPLQNEREGGRKKK
jgi:hypothetical protein